MDHMMNVLFLAGFSLYRCVQCYPRNRIWQLSFYLSLGYAAVFALISIVGER